MSLRWLFVDMNSYFASVEQQDRPELRRRPVAVVPTNVPTTFVLAASYEAKRFKVTTGVMVRDALRMCPGLQIVEARQRLYVEYHHRILAAVETVLPVHAVLSVDEMVCRLQGNEQEEEEALRLAMAIKAAIYANVGEQLRCSIGISTNRLLAKLASDLQKPDGLTVIQQEDLPDRLLSLQLRDFCGIGPKMEKRFYQHGVRTVEKLLDLSPAEMSKIWGSDIVGKSWWLLLRGADLEEKKTHRRSVGNSRVLAPDLRTMDSARVILTRLLHKAAERLRHIGYLAGSIHVSVSYIGRTRWDERKRILAAADTLSLLRSMLPLWEKAPLGTPLKVAVTLSDLVPPESKSASLFDEDRRQDRLGEAMDKINRSFGSNMVHFGGMMGASHAVGTHIAFGLPPDLELPDA